MKDRQAVAPPADCPSPPVPPTRAPAQGIDAGAAPRPADPARGLSHQPLQAPGHSLGRGPRHYAPPPSLSMHPASMLILDNEVVLGAGNV